MVEKGGKANTIDNGATTLPITFLAQVANATGEPKYRDAALRGVDYLLASQYANGGFPQFFPLRKGYYAHITYNDGAMINALTLLRELVVASFSGTPCSYYHSPGETLASDLVGPPPDSGRQAEADVRRFGRAAAGSAGRCGAGSSTACLPRTHQTRDAPRGEERSKEAPRSGSIPGRRPMAARP